MVINTVTIENSISCVLDWEYEFIFTISLEGRQVMTFINTILVMKEPEKREAKAFPSVMQQIQGRLNLELKLFPLLWTLRQLFRLIVWVLGLNPCCWERFYSKVKKEKS